MVPDVGGAETVAIALTVALLVLALRGWDHRYWR
jgi:hypothetical protein